MFLTRIKFAALAVLLALCAAGAGLLAQRPSPPAAPPAPKEAAPAAGPKAAGPAWADRGTIKAPGYAVLSVAASLDGWVAAGTSAGVVLRWDPDGVERPPVKVGGKGAMGVAFDPGRRLAVAGGENMADVSVWPSGARGGTLLKGHTRPVYSVAFSPDGRTLVSGGEDGVRLWDPDKGKELTHLTWPVGWQDGGLVKSVAFSPDGRTVAAGGFGKKDAGLVRLWDLATRNEITTLRYDSPGNVYAVAFSPEGRTLAIASLADVRLWDPQKQKERANFRILRDGRLPREPIHSLAFSPDGRTLAIGLDSVKLYDSTTLRELADLKVTSSTFLHVAFSPFSDRLFAAGTVHGKDGYGFVQVWEPQK